MRKRVGTSGALYLSVSSGYALGFYFTVFHHSNMSSVASEQQSSVSAGYGTIQIALVVGSEGLQVRPCDLR